MLILKVFPWCFFRPVGKLDESQQGLQATSHERSHKTTIFSSKLGAKNNKDNGARKIEPAESSAKVQKDTKEKCLDDYFHFKQKMIQLK